MKIEIDAFTLAQRFIGIKEIPGKISNPQILSMLQLDFPEICEDEVPWCSAFVNYIAWLLRLPRSKSLMARSWLTVGKPVSWESVEPGFSVVVLKQNSLDPGPEVIQFPGHVGFLASPYTDVFFPIHVLGGNQGDSVSISSFAVDKILGIRDLWIG